VIFTTDGGLTWRCASLSRTLTCARSRWSRRPLYASGTGGALISNDGGRSWVERSLPIKGWREDWTRCRTARLGGRHRRRSGRSATTGGRGRSRSSPDCVSSCHRQDCDRTTVCRLQRASSARRRRRIALAGARDGNRSSSACRGREWRTAWVTVGGFGGRNHARSSRAPMVGGLATVAAPAGGRDLYGACATPGGVWVVGERGLLASSDDSGRHGCARPAVLRSHWHHL